MNLSPELKEQLPELLLGAIEQAVMLFGENGTATHCEQAVNLDEDPCNSHTIGRKQWRYLRRRGAKHGQFLGVIHSHPWGNPEPSPDDISAVRRWYTSPRQDAIYHPESGTLIWFDRNGIIRQEQLRKAKWYAWLA